MTSSLSLKSLVIETRNSFSLNFVSSFVIVIVWLSFFRRYLDLFCFFLSHFRLCIFVISLLHSVPQLKSLYSCRKIRRKKRRKGHDSHYNHIHHGYFLISIFLSLTSFLDFSSAHSSSLLLWFNAYDLKKRDRVDYKRRKRYRRRNNKKTSLLCKKRTHVKEKQSKWCRQRRTWKEVHGRRSSSSPSSSLVLIDMYTHKR